MNVANVTNAEGSNEEVSFLHLSFLVNGKWNIIINLLALASTFFSVFEKNIQKENCCSKKRIIEALRGNFKSEAKLYRLHKPFCCFLPLKNVLWTNIKGYFRTLLSFKIRYLLSQWNMNLNKMDDICFILLSEASVFDGVVTMLKV